MKKYHKREFVKKNQLFPFIICTFSTKRSCLCVARQTLEDHVVSLAGSWGRKVAVRISEEPISFSGAGGTGRIRQKGSRRAGFKLTARAAFREKGNSLLRAEGTNGVYI